MLDSKICQKARLSRDPRFDGKFFTAVKTTGIYCRTICPVYPPKEKNVLYFPSAVEAANAGFRPCLRCRPDSAPGSPAWKGTNATLDRAIRLIDEGALQDGSLEKLADQLGITDRYLRRLFDKSLGISPKAYALYQQCLFAKQLLHQTNLPIIQVAFASGFKSLRRFNDCFKTHLKLTPSQVRKKGQSASNILQLNLYYRPPYDWSSMQRFLLKRAISKLEWCDETSYGRTFNWLGSLGHFTARHDSAKNRFIVTIGLDDLSHLKAVVANIRRVLDMNVDIQAIESDIEGCIRPLFPLKSGLRLPGIWSSFEAGVRAILGQQISVTAAHELVRTLVEELGNSIGDNKIFPSPESLVESDFDFLKIPMSRKKTLRNLAQHYLDHDTPDDLSTWHKLEGIGPWTIGYVQMRGQSDPDVYLDSDLGVKNALQKYTTAINSDMAAPWRSYLTLQLWNQL
ncbi:DNA-3-methyladenine glycosylase 2 family protein [Kiloniella majae]|uniref:DNA-3-methyladenine glycosylase 2 family protein n=1 Tax=Kiloniella majae TaxID=1938558 RepID=UPI000A279019|nr:DNA-3-methyladenine glycosylase 2 family protein [Kiloniella majae]